MNVRTAATALVRLIDEKTKREMTSAALQALRDLVEALKTDDVLSQAIEDAARAVDAREVARRKSTLMRMAGNIAAGVVSDSARSQWSPQSIATLSVRIAENITRIVELQPSSHAMKGRES